MNAENTAALPQLTQIFGPRGLRLATAYAVQAHYDAMRLSDFDTLEMLAAAIPGLCRGKTLPKDVEDRFAFIALDAKMQLDLFYNNVIAESDMPKLE